MSVSNAHAAPTSIVDLGDATSFAVLSGASVANTVSGVGAPHTTIRGDVAVVPNTPLSGFPPGVIIGQTHVGTAAAASAHAAAGAAYAAIAGRAGGVPLAGALAGATITPGLYAVAGAVSNTTTVTLDAGGDPNAVFVFQVNGAMAMAAASRVVLAGGAQASRVFWQVNGAGAVGAGAEFVGTLIAADAVAIGTGTLVNGRLFARTGALTLDANEIYSNPPVVTIAGGSSAMTTDTTPMLTGTTDLVAPAQVTVTINGATLSALPAGGVWSIEAPMLANATYTVAASAVDGAGNTSSATQQLTVDTVLPVVSLDDGPSMFVNDSTPTLAGASDVAPGTLVHVSVGAQLLHAVVHTGGWWNITSADLADGAYAVVATVADPAGNDGVAELELTVDTSAPTLAVVGGSASLTSDATPTISGTALGAVGQPISIDLADDTVTGIVAGDGSWALTAAALTHGVHRVIVRVADAAGNASVATQWLTVDLVSPLITIAGGSAAATIDRTPTITGSTQAAPASMVTVTIAGQSMTTLSQLDGSWNVTPSAVLDGSWSVVATVPDLAGNVGSFEQVLTVAPLGIALPRVDPPPAPVVPGPVVPPLAPAVHFTPVRAGTNLASVAKFGFVTSLRINQAGTITSRLSISAKVAKRLGLLRPSSRSTKPVVIGTKVVRVAEARTVTLTTVVTLRAKRALVASRLSVAVSQRVVVTTPSGARVVTRTIVLRPTR